MAYKRDLFCAENMNFKKEIEQLKEMGASEKDVREIIIEALDLRLHIVSLVYDADRYVRHLGYHLKWGYSMEGEKMPKSIGSGKPNEAHLELKRGYKIFQDFFLRKKKTTPEKLAEKYGCSRPNVYAYLKHYLKVLNHPRSKQEIYQRLLERVVNQN